MLDLLISFINMLIISIPYFVIKFTFNPPNPPRYGIKKNKLNNQEEIYFLSKTKINNKMLVYEKVEPKLFSIKYSKVYDSKNNKYIPILKITPKNVNKLCIIYCQGNNGDLGTSLFECHNIAVNCHCTIVTFEYPGYGICENDDIKELEFYNRIKLIYIYIINELGYNQNQIFLYGFSLGSGIVFDFACRNEYPLAGMILQSPFLSILRTVYNIKKTKYFDLFNNCDKAKNLRVNTLFLHGNKDPTVPYVHGRILAKLIPEKYFYDFLTVDNARHNNLLKSNPDEIFRLIKSFMNDCILDAANKIKFNNFFMNDKNEINHMNIITREENLDDNKKNEISKLENNKTKSKTFANLKITTYNNADEIQNNDTDMISRQNIYSIESKSFKIIPINKNTRKSNLSDEKSISQNGNKIYYHVHIGTNNDLYNQNYKNYNTKTNKENFDNNNDYENYNSLISINSSKTNINNNIKLK